MAKASVHRSVRPSAANPSKALIGQQLLGVGKLTEDQIIRIVSVQREQNIRFGEAAVNLGLVTREDVREALSRQFSYPYVGPDGGSFSPLLVTATQPHCPQSEAFRAVRSQLLLRLFDDRRKALCVTAGRSGQGASTLAANLAVLFAQMGERTLLIDANLRKPSQLQIFGLQSGAGLSDVLTGRCATQEVLNPIAGFDSLFVLAGGAPPPNPQELLSRVSFSYLIETAPAGFDIVIVDTPPILEFADAQIVASLTKACILAVKRHEARVNDISEVRVQLQPTAAELVGAVMFD